MQPQVGDMCLTCKAHLLQHSYLKKKNALAPADERQKKYVQSVTGTPVAHQCTHSVQTDRGNVELQGNGMK